MGRVAMETKLTRGAVAALLTLGFVAPLGAQATGRIEVRREPRDSAEMRAVLMTKARLDSVMTLMREFREVPSQSAEAEVIRKRIDALMPSMSSRMLIRPNGPGAPAFPKGWIGINAQGPRTIDFGPEGYTVQYFDYPAIISVDPESPAKRAGIVPGDVLIAYDGVDVKGHRFDLTQMLVPEKKLSVAVRHDGEPKEYVLTVAQAPVQLYPGQLEPGGRGKVYITRSGPGVGDVPRDDDVIFQRPLPAGSGGAAARVGMLVPLRTFFLSQNGAFGAILSTVKPELAKTLKLETGVLVNDVTDETPASVSGLRPGDVIVNVGGQSVASLEALQEILKMRRADRSVVLDVVRDKKPRKVTVNW